MAWQHIDAVRRLPLQPTAKSVLLALALRANNDDRCWPSIRTLCEDTGLARRTVQLHLARLAEGGAITRDVGTRRTSRFCLRLSAFAASLSSEQRNNRAFSGQSVDGGCTERDSSVQEMQATVQEMRLDGTSGAPESKEKLFQNIHEKGSSDHLSVDNSELSSKAHLPWWKSEGSVILQGMKLGVTARPGETYQEFKDRVFTVWRERGMLARQRSDREP